MRRFALPLVIVATVIVAAALAWYTLTRAGGSGSEMTTEVRAVAPFRRLEINGRAEGSGALKATLAGQVVEQRISISGAGDVRGDKLVAVVDVSGAGSIVINAAKTLRATISGAGRVEYYGDPEVKQSVSGIGRVKRRSGSAPQGTASGEARARYWIAKLDGASTASALNISRSPVAGSRSA